MKEYIKPECKRVGVVDINICNTSHLTSDTPGSGWSDCNCDITSPWYDQGCIGCECGCRD